VDGAALPPGNRGAYAGTATIADIDTAAAILLVGTNPRDEAPVLNARIRRAWSRGASIGVVGPAVDLTYDYRHFGSDRAALSALVQHDYSDLQGKSSLVILGQGAIRGADGAAVLAQAAAICAASGAKLLVLHSAASRVGAMDVGAVAPGGLAQVLGSDVILNLGADEVEIPAGPVVVYIGHHGDRGAHRADIILPSAAWVEENGLFVNTEGRPQLAMRAGFPPGEAKETWAILRALSGEMGAALPWDSLAALRQALVKAHPVLGGIDQVAEKVMAPLDGGALGSGDFGTAVGDFYLTNPVARASALMADLSRRAAGRVAQPLAAE
jgi:NADH-quinone oxidoreductase subunit G